MRTSQDGSFGYGWRLPIRDFQLESDLSAADNTGLGSSLPYREGTRVYATLPDGQRVAFTFKPELKQIPGLSYYLPKWEADNGVQWTMTSMLAHLQRVGDRFYDIATGMPYNPQTQASTAQFTLTGPDGTQYDINAATGTSQLRFSDGVSWKVSDSGIVASNGDRVSFMSNDAGRMDRIQLSDGRQFAYSYDTAGNPEAEIPPIQLDAPDKKATTRKRSHR